MIPEPRFAAKRARRAMGTRASPQTRVALMVMAVLWDLFFLPWVMTSSHFALSLLASFSRLLRLAWRHWEMVLSMRTQTSFRWFSTVQSAFLSEGR